jgi:hypothetical protein
MTETIIINSLCFIYIACAASNNIWELLKFIIYMETKKIEKL